MYHGGIVEIWVRKEKNKMNHKFHCQKCNAPLKYLYSEILNKYEVEPCESCVMAKYLSTTYFVGHGRLEEMEELRTLLREVSAINNGSHCLERIKKCIGIADKLQECDRKAGVKSFVDFISDICESL